MARKLMNFQEVILSSVVDKSRLSELSWNGIPDRYRAVTWKTLCGYLPVDSSQRISVLKRKREEYMMFAATCYGSCSGTADEKTLRQISLDVPRTAPDVALFQHPRVRISLERMLYTWAKQNPASSYVQGMNDLATPLFVVFISDVFFDGNVKKMLSAECFDPTKSTPMDMMIYKGAMEQVEADCYWCFTSLLLGIQDHYTPGQPGLCKMVKRLEHVLQRVDPDLHNHLKCLGVEFVHFSFRWMNCLLLRELNLWCIVRMWDTYFSEGPPSCFEEFHVFVCASLLDNFTPKMLQMREFDEIVSFTQNLPTSDWSEKEVELLLSQAFVFRSAFLGKNEGALTKIDGVKPPRETMEEQSDILSLKEQVQNAFTVVTSFDVADFMKAQVMDKISESATTSTVDFGFLSV